MAWRRTPKNNHEPSAANNQLQQTALRAAAEPKRSAARHGVVEACRSLKMSITWTTIIWQQFGAAIDTLDDMLRACPDDLWRARL